MRARALAAFLAALAAVGCNQDIPVVADAPVATGQGYDPPLLRTLASRYWHTCAALAGSTWCWGKNDHHALGTFQGASSSVPVKLETARQFLGISVGLDFGCGLDRAGEVACWGSNLHGQLGQGDTVDRDAPFSVVLEVPTAQVSAGSNHVCTIGVDGSLRCWGYNRENGVGVGGPPGAAPDELLPRRVGIAADWSYVSAGDGHTCGIRRDGSLWCWGRNSELECGLGAGSSVQITEPVQVGQRQDWLMVTTGQQSTCALDRGLSIWCWGLNQFGLLGVPGETVSDPTRVGARSDWVEIQVNTFDSCARTRAGALYCWGYNEYGELGLGDRIQRTDPTAVFSEVTWQDFMIGRQHTCGRQSDGSLWCAGRSLEGQVGNGSTGIVTNWERVVIH